VSHNEIPPSHNDTPSWWVWYAVGMVCCVHGARSVPVERGRIVGMIIADARCMPG